MHRANRLAAPALRSRLAAGNAWVVDPGEQLSMTNGIDRDKRYLSGAGLNNQHVALLFERVLIVEA